MFQRVLWVSLTQALRSVALLLLPIAFISLFAWATAGSSNGNTSDPIRATLWLWLAAHHIPFHLILSPGQVHGLLSYLPVGAMLFPALAIRSGYIRACDRLDASQQEKQLTRALFALMYTSIASLIAWRAATSAIAPNLYWTPVVAIALVWCATMTSKQRSRSFEIAPHEIALRVMTIILGISSIVFGIDLALHIKTVENLTVILQPGFIGGLLLLLMNILYLPNAIVATLSYLAGPGFAVGAHTLISPLTHRVSEIPALPFLGGLPTGPHPLTLICGLGMIAIGAVIYNVTITQSSAVIIKSYLLVVSCTGALAFLSSGSLITSAMSAVGVSAWQLSLAAACEIGLGIILAMVVPRVLDAVPRFGK